MKRIVASMAAVAAVAALGAGSALADTNNSTQNATIGQNASTANANANVGIGAGSGGGKSWGRGGSSKTVVMVDNSAGSVSGNSAGIEQSSFQVNASLSFGGRH